MTTEVDQEHFETGFRLKPVAGGEMKIPKKQRCFSSSELEGRLGDFKMPSRRFRQFCAPAFLVIGFGRCGTTSLAKYLSSHPAISFGTRKEHFYFYRPEFCDLQHGPNQRWPQCDVGAYASQFPVSDGKNITFDATPMLGGDMGVPASIETMGWLRSNLPQLKLIALVKSPADRFLSNPLATAKVKRFQDSLVMSHHKEGVMPSKLRQLIMDNCYIEKLEKWLQFFPTSRFFLVRSEDLKGDFQRRQRILDSIHAFLGVPAYVYPREVLEYVGHENRATNTTLDPTVRALINCLPELRRCERRIEAKILKRHPNVIFNWCDDARAQDGVTNAVKVVASRAPISRPTSPPENNNNIRKRRRVHLKPPTTTTQTKLLRFKSSLGGKKRRSLCAVGKQACAPSFMVLNPTNDDEDMATLLGSHPELSGQGLAVHRRWFDECQRTACSMKAYTEQFPLQGKSRTFGAVPLRPEHRRSVIQWYSKQMPTLKFIIVAVNPVDRMAAMHPSIFTPEKIKRIRVDAVSPRVTRLLRHQCYIDHITPWFQFFHPSQFALIVKDFKDQDLLDAVHRFLDLPPFEYPPGFSSERRSVFSPETRAALNCVPDLKECQMRLLDALDAPRNALDDWCVLTK